ncbi:unnamed protein product [Dicrocoelium dendriticum]|nr:unnamed protein product [Dicrocoelium dendriticum]
MPGYSSYYTVRPCQNKYLQRYFDKERDEVNKKALANLKPSVDTSAPKSLQLSHLNSKNCRFKQETRRHNELENARLALRIKQISQSSGQIPNQPHHKPKSLQETYWRKEGERIKRDNHDLAQRLNALHCASYLNQWKFDWARNLVYMDNLSHFPWNWWSKRYCA